MNSIDADTEKRLTAMARAISRKAAGEGLICLVRDAEGKAHLIPGHHIELVAVYGTGAKIAWIVEDLVEAGIER